MLKENLRRYKIMEKHIELVRGGEYQAANCILCLLRHGCLSLGLDDVSFRVERILEDAGLRPRYSRNFNLVTFRLQRRG